MDNLQKVWWNELLSTVRNYSASVNQIVPNEFELRFPKQGNYFLFIYLFIYVLIYFILFKEKITNKCNF